MSKKYIKFSKPHHGNAEKNALIKVINSGWLTTGKKTTLFENNFKEYKNSKYALALNSCTAALHTSLLLLNLKKGEEVITSAMTFSSTINSIIVSGAKPVLADVELGTQNIDPIEIEKKITKKTKAILIVHFAGRPCDMDKIMIIVKKYNLHLIEDCAHSIESKYKGKHLGTFGTFGCFSFYATKNLSIGEGGMLITSNKRLYEKARILSLHGMDKAAWNRYGKQGYRHYDVSQIGYKYNLMDLLSVIGIIQLKKINKHLKVRKQIFNMYLKNFQKQSFMMPDKWDPKMIQHSYHLFNIFLDKKRDGVSRDEAILKLHKKKIGVGVHYRAIPEHSIYRKLFNWKINDFPNAKKIGRETISLPLSPSLKEQEIKIVINAIKKIVQK
jgi:dTDP-4-amino-4,6-dideoxygalactose transaminase